MSIGKIFGVSDKSFVAKDPKIAKALEQVRKVFEVETSYLELHPDSKLSGRYSVLRSAKRSTR